MFETAEPLKYLFFMNALCIAFVDVVIDGMNCIQQRKDPKNGAEDLQSFSWVSHSIGQIFGSIGGGVITKYFNGTYAFYMYSLTVLGEMASACNMS